jgi:hypothetical protein
MGPAIAHGREGKASRGRVLGVLGVLEERVARRIGQRV